MESININPTFVDGNKRTGFLTKFAIVSENNIKLTANIEDICSFAIKVSTGETKFEDIVH